MTTIEKAAEELRTAETRFEAARREYETASRAHTIALNGLNTAQKAFDEAVAEVKKKAPRDSDWADRSRGECA